MNFNFNTRDVNLSAATTDGFQTIQTGWYKFVLYEVGEEREEKSGNAFGALFTFKIVEGDCEGLTFRKWFCTQAKQASAKWRQANFENIICRIAQCVGVDQLTSCEQLFNKPFYAFVTANEREYESKKTDRDGNFIIEKTTDVDFAKGRIVDNILSCADFAARNAEPVDLALETPF